MSAPRRRIPAYHPLAQNPRTRRLYSHEGRPSIPPKQLLSALILQVLYSVRSERQLMEQLDYNLLFRWFVGLSPDDPIWDPTVFTKNRERLQEGDVFQKFMTKLLKHEKVRPLLSDEHFSVDGTLIEAWASHKSSNRSKPRRTMTARTFMASYARRLNKLSCAGWVPHDRGSVSGLPRSRVEHRSGDRLITGPRVPHRGPASSNVHLGF